jgi:hypothetical protein
LTIPILICFKRQLSTLKSSSKMEPPALKAKNPKDLKDLKDLNPTFNRVA